MKRIKVMKKVLCIIAAFALCFAFCALSACKNQPEEKTKVALTVEKTSATIGIGKTFEIKATAENTEAKISFSSDSNDIASVDENGVVTGVAAGEATITVSVEEEKAEVKITVADYTVDVKTRTVNIYCKEGLLSFAEKINARETSAKRYTINLLCDVDLGQDEWTPLYGYALTGSVINGNGYTISNFKITAESSASTSDGKSIKCMAFVGGSYGITFKNITFSDVTINNEGEAYCAVVIGYLEGTGTFENVTVKNCKISALNSRRGAAALVGYAHDRVGDDNMQYLIVRNCTVQNVEIESQRAAGLVARVQEHASFNVAASGEYWKAEILNNKVEGCTFRCTAAFESDQTATLHWATTLPYSAIGAVADEGNDFSGNSYYFDGIEYEYSAGAFTKTCDEPCK